MALGEIGENIVGVSSIGNISLTDLPPNIISGIGGLINILKAAGIVFIGYILFLAIKSILAWKRHKKIDNTHKIVIEINRKLDLLLSDKKKEKLNELKKLEKKLTREKQKHKGRSKKKPLFKNLFKKSKK